MLYSALSQPCMWCVCAFTNYSATCAGKKGKSGGGKKGGSKLVLPAGSEQLLTHICVALDFLVAADNTDCYRVAAAGCLPALVQLASSQKNTQLRRAAKVC